MSTRKVMMLYGERLGTFSKRIPESKRAEIEAEWTSLMKKYEKPTLVEISVGKDKAVEVEKPKVIKEPTRTKFVPFTTKDIMISGYGCKIEKDEETVYWKDTLQTALVFDNQAHAKEWLTKNKP